MKFELYKDSQEQWRWRLKANNHRVVAVSGEGYHNLRDCKRGIEITQEASLQTSVTIEK